MFLDSPLFLVASLLGGLFYVSYLKGKDRFKRGFLVLFFICLFGTLMNGLFTHNGASTLFYIGPNRITVEAIVYGLVMSTKISAVIIWFMSFSEIMTSDKLINIFGHLAPVLGLTVSMIFRFIPLLKRRYNEIRIGQLSLGRGEVKGPINKLSQRIKELSVLISWSLEASIESADSMAARGYGLPGRTSYRIFKFDKRDGIISFISLVLACVTGMLLYLGAWRIYYYPVIQSYDNTTVGVQTVCIMTFIVLAFFPLLFDLYEDYKWKKLA